MISSLFKFGVEVGSILTLCLRPCGDRIAPSDHCLPRARLGACRRPAAHGDNAVPGASRPPRPERFISSWVRPGNAYDVAGKPWSEAELPSEGKAGKKSDRQLGKGLGKAMS